MQHRTASFNSVCISNNINNDYFEIPSISLNNHIRSATLLPMDYTPGNWDVICIRGKDCPQHVGNRRFRICIENHVDTYRKAKTRQDKSCVITSIVRSIKDSSPQTGGFVMKDSKTERWHRVDNKVARDKVGNALRDTSKLRTEEDSAFAFTKMGKLKQFPTTVMKNKGSSSFHNVVSSSLHSASKLGITAAPHHKTIASPHDLHDNKRRLQMQRQSIIMMDDPSPFKCVSGTRHDNNTSRNNVVEPSSLPTITATNFGSTIHEILDMFDDSDASCRGQIDLEPRPLKMVQ